MGPVPVVTCCDDAQVQCRTVALPHVLFAICCTQCPSGNLESRCSNSCPPYALLTISASPLITHVGRMFTLSSPAMTRPNPALPAQASSQGLPDAVFHALSALLTSGPVDYMDESNTHIISMRQLPPIAFTGRRRRGLLAAAASGSTSGSERNLTQTPELPVLPGTTQAGRTAGDRGDTDGVSNNENPGPAGRRGASLGKRGRAAALGKPGRGAAAGAGGGGSGGGRLGSRRAARRQGNVSQVGGRRMGPRARRRGSLPGDADTQVPPTPSPCIRYASSEEPALCESGQLSAGFGEAGVARRGFSGPLWACFAVGGRRVRPRP